MIPPLNPQTLLWKVKEWGRERSFRVYDKPHTSFSIKLVELYVENFNFQTIHVKSVSVSVWKKFCIFSKQTKLFRNNSNNYDNIKKLKFLLVVHCPNNWQRRGYDKRRYSRVCKLFPVAERSRTWTWNFTNLRFSRWKHLQVWSRCHAGEDFIFSIQKIRR